MTFHNHELLKKIKQENNVVYKLLILYQNERKKNPLNTLLRVFFKTRLFSESRVHTPHKTLKIVSNPQ